MEVGNPKDKFTAWMKKDKNIAGLLNKGATGSFANKIL